MSQCNFKRIPRSQFLEVIRAPNAARLICAIARLESRVSVQLGDAGIIHVPLAFFSREGQESPTFDELEILDYGHGVSRGDFEASTDSIIEESERANAEVTR